MKSWILFALVVIGITALVNKLTGSAIIGILLSSILSTIVFQIIVWVQLGHPDKFLYIAVAITFPVALAISGLQFTVCKYLKKY